MESLKTYLIEVGLKRLGPSFVKGAIAALVGFLAAHQGILETWGVTLGNWPLAWPAGQEPSGRVILIELDTLSATAMIVFTGLAMTFLTAMQHHTTAAIKGKPQSGDLRTEPSPSITGGDRKEDPPA